MNLIQTVYILIRCPVLLHLIWVYTVCQCPFHRFKCKCAGCEGSFFNMFLLAKFIHLVDFFFGHFSGRDNFIYFLFAILCPKLILTHRKQILFFREVSSLENNFDIVHFLLHHPLPPPLHTHTYMHTDTHLKVYPFSWKSFFSVHWMYIYTNVLYWCLNILEDNIIFIRLVVIVLGK